MLIDEPAIEALLNRLVSRLATDRKELMQEARIWLWKVESASPGKTRSGMSKVATLSSRISCAQAGALTRSNATTAAAKSPAVSKGTTRRWKTLLPGPF
jgi:hypothetical protein